MHIHMYFIRGRHILGFVSHLEIALCWCTGHVLCVECGVRVLYKVNDKQSMGYAMVMSEVVVMYMYERIGLHD